MNFESPLGLLLFSFLPLFFFTLNTILKKRQSKVASFHILSEIIDSLPRLPSSFLLRKRFQKALLYASVVLLALSAGGLVLGDSAPEGVTGVMVLDHLSGWQDRDENGGWEHVRRRADELARRFRADDRLLVLRSDLAEASSGLLPPRRAAAYLASLGESSMPLDLPRVAGELRLLQSLLEPEFMAVVTPLPSRWEKIAEENSLPLVVVPSLPPPAKPNLALLDVEVRPHLLSPTDVSLFCRVGAFASPGSDGPVEAVIQVFSAGTMLFEKDLLLTPGETEGVAIPSLQLSPGVLELRILPEDHFSEDNHFFSHIRSRPFLTVALAKSEHKFLEAALRSLPGLSLLDFDPDDRESHRSAGVIVADGPVGPVEGNLLLIHPSRDYPGFSLSGATSGLSRIESDASHPVLDEVSFGSLHLDRLPVILPSPSLRVVASADGYPLLLLGRNAGGGRLAVIAFDPVSTGWIREASFPILIANLVSWLGEDRGGTGASLRVGDPLPRAALAGAKRLTAPGGRTLTRPDGGWEESLLVNAGRYRAALPDGKDEAEFFVNLLREEVSVGAVRGEPGEVGAAPPLPFPLPFRRAMKVPLLLAAVAFIATAMLITPREQVGRLEE